MRPNVSILVGSGFSIPEGLPSVEDLNKRLKKIDESEFIIDGERKANFLSEEEAISCSRQTDPIRYIRWDESILIQELLEFYNNKILKEKEEEFNYETFYDFFSGYLYPTDRENPENKEAIEGFCKQFYDMLFEVSENYMVKSCHNRISEFNLIFSNLLASQLGREKYFENKIIEKHEGYDSFIGFLIDLLKVSNIKFHSLNHDLFFDWLAQNHKDLSPHFTDGYQLEGSPFYGEVSSDLNPGTDNKTGIPLKQFVDKFDKPLALFKLHGSLSNKKVFTSGKRFKSSPLVSGFYMQTTDSKTGEQKRESLTEELAPDFLSGTTNKILNYDRDPYYKILLNHFEKNLSTSDLLVVIGYGFQDTGINEYLLYNFLIWGKHMVVIDSKDLKDHKKTTTDLFEQYNVTYIQKGVTEITGPEYEALIPEELKNKK